MIRIIITVILVTIASVNFAGNGMPSVPLSKQFRQRLFAIQCNEDQFRNQNMNEKWLDLVKAEALNYSGEWQPQTRQNYSYGYSGWQLDTTNCYLYENGQLRNEWITPADSDSNIEYTYHYDDNGNLIKLIETKAGIEYRKTEFIYDSDVTDQIIGKLTYLINNNGEYQYDSGWTSDIIKDENGLITDYIINTVYYGELKPCERYIVNYDSKGIACSIEYYENDLRRINPKWVECMRIYAIEWNRTDSQLFFFPSDENDIVSEYTSGNFFTGSNRISYAKVELKGVPTPALLLVDYSEDKDYSVSTTIEDVEISKTDVAFKDTFGSIYVESRILEEYDMWPFEGYLNTSLQVEFEEFGLQTLYAISEWTEAEDYDPMPSVYVKKGEIEYDPQFGYPLEVCYYEEGNSEGIVPTQRYVYSDYIDIESKVDIQIQDCQLEYYNLNGMRVTNSTLPPGIYVIKGNGVITKRMVR